MSRWFISHHQIIRWHVLQMIVMIPTWNTVCVKISTVKEYPLILHTLHLYSTKKQYSFIKHKQMIITCKKYPRLWSAPKTNCSGTRSIKQLGRPGELATWLATKANVFLSNGNVSSRKAAISSRISHSIYKINMVP